MTFLLRYGKTGNQNHVACLQVEERRCAFYHLDCSQSIFPWDRRGRARLTINGGHLDFQSLLRGHARPLGTAKNQDGRH